MEKNKGGHRGWSMNAEFSKSSWPGLTLSPPIHPPRKISDGEKFLLLFFFLIKVIKPQSTAAGWDMR